MACNWHRCKRCGKVAIEGIEYCVKCKRIMSARKKTKTILSKA